MDTPMTPDAPVRAGTTGTTPRHVTSPASNGAVELGTSPVDVADLLAGLVEEGAPPLAPAAA